MAKHLNTAGDTALAAAIIEAFRDTGIPNEITSAQHVIHLWASETFQHDPAAIIRHMREEFSELAFAVHDYDADPSPATARAVETEMADLFILLCGLAGYEGMSLFDAAAAKMRVNFGRQWVKCPDGVSRHADHAMVRAMNSGSAVTDDRD